MWKVVNNLNVWRTLCKFSPKLSLFLCAKVQKLCYVRESISFSMPLLLVVSRPSRSLFSSFSSSGVLELVHFWGLFLDKYFEILGPNFLQIFTTMNTTNTNSIVTIMIAEITVFFSQELLVFCQTRGTSILGEVHNVWISRATQQLLCSISHNFLAVLF